MLFYADRNEYMSGGEHHAFAQTLFGVEVEFYLIKEHREEYDHNASMAPNSCWCQIPDSNDQGWPKLYITPVDPAGTSIPEPVFLAAGEDIFKLDSATIVHRYGNDFV